MRLQPYGDPHAPFQRKCAFDVGDYVSQLSFTCHPSTAVLGSQFKRQFVSDVFALLVLL